MNKEERLKVLEMVILDVQEEIEKEQGVIRLFQLDRHRIAKAIDAVYSVDEGKAYSILKKKKDGRVDFKVALLVKALSQNDETLKVEVEDENS